MSSAVKPVVDGNRRRAARTEARILDAARSLFVRSGYQGTSLAAVAASAEVGERTVYVRFGTKAELFKRVIDVAIVGDTEAVDVLGRTIRTSAMTAPTIADRIAATAAISGQIMSRTGPLFAVAQQAAAVEPLIERYWVEGRAATHHLHKAIWTKAATDGLLSADVDLSWVVDTAAVVGSAETYLAVNRMLGSDADAYRGWLTRVLTAILS